MFFHRNICQCFRIEFYEGEKYYREDKVDLEGECGSLTESGGRQSMMIQAPT